jgi:hypothetical protein
MDMMPLLTSLTDFTGWVYGIFTIKRISFMTNDSTHTVAVIYNPCYAEDNFKQASRETHPEGLL